MEEVLAQGGELVVGIVAALTVVGSVMLLLSGTDIGVLRVYLTGILEAVC